MLLPIASGAKEGGGGDMESTDGSSPWLLQTVINTRNKVQGRLVAPAAGSAGHAQVAVGWCEPSMLKAGE